MASREGLTIKVSYIPGDQGSMVPPCVPYKCRSRTWITTRREQAHEQDQGWEQEQESGAGIRLPDNVAVGSGRIGDTGQEQEGEEGEKEGEEPEQEQEQAQVQKREQEQEQEQK